MHAYKSVIKQRRNGLPIRGYMHKHLYRAVCQVCKKMGDDQLFEKFIVDLDNEKDLSTVCQSVNIVSIRYKMRDGWEDSKRTTVVGYDDEEEASQVSSNIRRMFLQTKDQTRNLDRIALYWLYFLGQSKQGGVYQKESADNVLTFQLNYTTSPWNYVFRFAILVDGTWRNFRVVLKGMKPDPRKKRRGGKRVKKTLSNSLIEQHLAIARAEMRAQLHDKSASAVSQFDSIPKTPSGPGAQNNGPSYN